MKLYELSSADKNFIQDPYVPRDDPSVWRDQYGTEYVGRNTREHMEPCHDNVCPNFRTYYEAMKRGDTQTQTTMEKNTEYKIFKESGWSKGDYNSIASLIGFFVFWGLIITLSAKISEKVYFEWKPETRVGKIVQNFLRVFCSPLVLFASFMGGLGNGGGTGGKQEEITIVKDGVSETYIKK